MPDQNNPLNNFSTPTQSNPVPEPVTPPVIPPADIQPTQIPPEPIVVEEKPIPAAEPIMPEFLSADSSSQTPFIPDSGSGAPAGDIPLVVVPSEKPSKGGPSKARLAAIISGILVLVGGASAGVYLLKQNQDARSKATGWIGQNWQNTQTLYPWQGQPKPVSKQPAQNNEEDGGGNSGDQTTNDITTTTNCSFPRGGTATCKRDGITYNPDSGTAEINSGFPAIDDAIAGCGAGNYHQGGNNNYYCGTQDSGSPASSTSTTTPVTPIQCLNIKVYDSAWVPLSTTGTSSVMSAGTYEDSDAKISYSGNWITWTGAGDGGVPHGNTLKYTDGIGDSASFAFSGNKITIYFAGYNNRGKMAVNIDGGEDIIVNQYSATPQWQKTWSQTVNAGTHSVTITNKSTSPNRIDIDTFVIEGTGGGDNPTSLSSLKAGDKIRLTVAGSPAASFDKAKFTVNGVERTETANKKPGTDEFYDEYTIPEGTTSFSVSAKLHHITNGWF